MCDVRIAPLHSFVAIASGHSPRTAASRPRPREFVPYCSTHRRLRAICLSSTLCSSGTRPHRYAPFAPPARAASSHERRTSAVLVATCHSSPTICLGTFSAAARAVRHCCPSAENRRPLPRLHNLVIELVTTRIRSCNSLSLAFWRQMRDTSFERFPSGKGSFTAHFPSRVRRKTWTRKVISKSARNLHGRARLQQR